MSRSLACSGGASVWFVLACSGGGDVWQVLVHSSGAGARLVLAQVVPEFLLVLASSHIFINYLLSGELTFWGWHM